MDKRSLAWGAALMALAVALGAFGAHGLKAKVDADALAQWNTGVQYHFLHALGLLLLANLGAQLPPKAISRIRMFFLSGILFFCLSLYLLSTRAILGTQFLTPILGPITPLGGLFFIVGWMILLITTLLNKDQG
ncbi:MAG: DUF423 domain-containing protein [Flavobacteriales bacterium]